MSYLRKHSFFLIVVFTLEIFGNGAYFRDLNMFNQWSFSIILTIVDLAFSFHLCGSGLRNDLAPNSIERLNI